MTKQDDSIERDDMAFYPEGMTVPAIPHKPFVFISPGLQGRDQDLARQEITDALASMGQYRAKNARGIANALEQFIVELTPIAGEEWTKEARAKHRSTTN